MTDVQDQFLFDGRQLMLPAAEPRATVKSASGTATAFVVFILINASLFMRPAEIVPALLHLPIYQVLNLLCIALCFPRLVQKLSRRFGTAGGTPITVCVIGLLFAVMMSHLSHFDFGSAAGAGIEFLKLVIYYLLLITLVDSPARLRSFLFWILLFTVALTVLAMLQYYGYIDIASLRPDNEPWLEETTNGETSVVVARLCGAGIFGNPNDLSRILVIGILIAGYFLTCDSIGRKRILFIAPVMLLGFALHLTHSRGGFLAFLAGLGILFYARYGLGRTVVLAVLALPVLLLVFGGRETDLNTSEGTGQQRIKLWSEGFEMLQQSPIFGIGKDQYMVRTGGLGAHNSFIHAFTELGVFGGVLFTGAFFLAIKGLLVKPDDEEADEIQQALYHLRPFLLAIVAGTIVGMLTSSRVYVEPSYMILGCVAVYFTLMDEYSPHVPLLPSRHLAFRAIRGSLVSLFVIWVYVRFAVRW